MKANKTQTKRKWEKLRKMVISINKVCSQLITVANISGTSKEKVDKYCELLDTILSNTGTELIDTLKLFVETIISEHVNVKISRQILNYAVIQLIKLPDAVSKQVLHYALDKVRPRILLFEEQVDGIRQHLVQIYERNQEWRKAANVLDDILWETGHEQYTVDYKLETCLKMTRFYLEDDDPARAELYINRASLLKAETTNEELKILYKVCYARVLDYHHNFIEAAQYYYDISCQLIVCEGQRMLALKKALVCTVLALAGEQRSRMLTILFKDGRCRRLPAYCLLQDMYLDLMIYRYGLKEIQGLLEPHQNVRTVDGISILERAILEHNLLSASQIYNCITFEELGDLLGIVGSKVQYTALQMIVEGRLNGHVDIIGNVVYFKTQ